MQVAVFTTLPASVGFQWCVSFKVVLLDRLGTGLAMQQHSNSPSRVHKFCDHANTIVDSLSLEPSQPDRSSNVKFVQLFR
jgi:hypothetical protein